MDNWIIGHDTPEDILGYLQLRSQSSGSRPIVCFDYFDTLVVRQIEPEHTKRIASQLLSHLLHEEIYSYRQEIEKNLCRDSAENDGEPEFHFVDFGSRLYKKIAPVNKNFLALTNEDSFIRILLDIEVAVERAVQDINREAVKVLQDLKANGFTTVLPYNQIVLYPVRPPMASWSQTFICRSSIFVRCSRRITLTPCSIIFLCPLIMG